MASEQCPKCGARRTRTVGGIDGEPVEFWSCGSDTDGDFNQSDDCRIRELEQQLAAVTAERDGAINDATTYREFYKIACEQIAEACQMLGLNPHDIPCDGWALRDTIKHWLAAHSEGGA